MKKLFLSLLTVLTVLTVLPPKADPPLVETVLTVLPPKADTFLTVVTGLLAAHAASFSDIRSGSQLDTYVQYLSDKGIISGYPDGTFQPSRTINRAEALKIIFETLSGELGEDTDSGFFDVEQTQWFAKYVTSAKNKNIVQGYGDGSYKPWQDVNRAEFIKMSMSALPFYYTLAKKASDTVDQFDDVYDEQWYTPHVSAGMNLGFINKTNKLDPTGPMTRQDAAEIIYKISQYVEANPDLMLLDPSNYSNEYQTEEIDISSGAYNVGPYDFGPDKLIVKHDIDQNYTGQMLLKTDIYNVYHGYNIHLGGLNEIARASGNSRDYENTLYIDFTTNQCWIYIDYFPQYHSPEDYYQNEYYLKLSNKVNNPGDDMFLAKNMKYEKDSRYPNVDVYKISYEWDLSPEGLAALGLDAFDESYFIYANNVIYDPRIPSGTEDKQQCVPYLNKILENFEIRK